MHQDLHRMDSDLETRICLELGRLFQEQMEALSANAVSRLSQTEALTYGRRRERICALCAELADLK